MLNPAGVLLSQTIHTSYNLHRGEGHCSHRRATTRCSRSGTTIIASRSHQKGGDCRADFASIPA